MAGSGNSITDSDKTLVIPPTTEPFLSDSELSLSHGQRQNPLTPVNMRFPEDEGVLSLRFGGIVLPILSSDFP